MAHHKQIAENLYMIAGRRSNIYLLTEGPAVLVDTGMPGDAPVILDVFRQIGFAPKDLDYICITHAHLDHVGSLAAMAQATGARIVASRLERDHIEGRRMLCSMRREGLGGVLFRALLYVMEKHLMPYRPAPVAVACGDRLQSGSVGGLNVIDTPGHSPGSLSYYYEEAQALFTGDAVSGVPVPRLPPRAGCSDYALALKSAEAISAIPCEICLFGHGEPVVEGAQGCLAGLLSQTIS